MNDAPLFDIILGDSPLVAAAIHDGHAVRSDVAAALALTSEERLREEDPFTGLWTEVAPTRIVGLRSRFEVDLNRPRDKAVYIEPADAWGLTCWKERPPDDLVQRSLAGYDAFYAECRRVLTSLVERHGRVVVFDLHSYNHRRGGPPAPPADPQENPEINIGAGSLDKILWGRVLETFVETLRGFDFQGRRLDVRVDVKFQGGHFPRWIHQNFHTQACALAIEVKKFFMDEWTGQPDLEQIDLVRQALTATVPPVLAALGKS